MMRVHVNWLLSILLFISGGRLNNALNEDANMTVTGSCIEKERQALLIFKEYANDGYLDDWGNEEEKRDCCKWTGVSCNNHTGHVIELDLSSTGNDFHSNHIPKVLGSLTNLQHLDISGANLSGPIPHQLGNLSNLLFLDLSGNSLVGSIPLSFEALTSLTYLNLSTNHLGGVIPNVFGNCSSLIQLDLSENFLNGSVPSFAGCSSLNKSLSDLPNSLGHVSNLEYLDVSSNSLNCVISDLHFESLSQLTYLDMSFNSLAFELSSLFRVPFQLKTIKLHSCKLGPSFPLWIKTQKSFEHLDISSAGISDSVPVWFWDLPLELEYLKLSSNELRGILPDITSDFVQYPGMDLSNNCLEGRVPLLPSKLASLKLSGNKFKGDLSFLCHIDGELTFIDLSNNSFSESLPDCWSKFPRLVVLNLSNNNLSGQIPLSFGFLNQLEALYMRKNAFVGELPMSMKDCTNLRFVDLGGNKLSGKIPAWIGERLSELYVLVLRSNMFTGSLTSNICWLYNLQFLDLSKNRLVGDLPLCFDNFTSMSSNWLSNDITNHYYSSYIQNMTNYHGTYLSSRRTCITYRCFFSHPRPHLGHTYVTYGGLEPGHPASDSLAVVEEFIIDNALVAWKGTDRSFGSSSLKLLKIIDLSNNNLSGNFPCEITSLVELVSLNLSFNKLHGELPKDIGRLKSLDFLDLSRNQFSGNIPSSLSQVNGLGYLDLSFNNFSGRIPLGTQLQSFNSSSYEGNPLLYGPPLTPTPAPTVVEKEEDEKHGDDDFWKSYYMGMGAGFAVGFWGICGTIFLNRRCRHLLFASLSLAKDWIYVRVAVLFRKFKRF